MGGEVNIWEGLDPRVILRIKAEGIEDIAGLKAFLAQNPGGREHLGRVMVAEVSNWLAEREG